MLSKEGADLLVVGDNNSKCFPKELWPDYTDADLERALEWYKRQDVTLGG